MPTRLPDDRDYALAELYHRAVRGERLRRRLPGMLAITSVVAFCAALCLSVGTNCMLRQAAAGALAMVLP
jgi:hypothetical protein